MSETPRTEDFMAAHIDALKAELAEARKVPDGWKLVPIESTGPMVNAAWLRVGARIGTGTIDEIWEAMVKAAPAP